MAELTEREVQEMIQKARAGDAEANFRMSEWALEQAVAEPEEERWNRLAAKCLVKAAEAGYQPAKERMDELIRQLDEEKAAAEVPADMPQEDDSFWDEPEPAYTEREPEARETGGFSLQTVTDGAAAVFGKAVGLFKDLIKKPQEGGAPAPEDDGAEGAHTARGGHSRSGGASSFLRFSEWNEAQWKKMQRICLIVCAALVVLIIILLISGRSSRNKEAEEEAQIPVAATAEPVQPTATPAAELYPDETTRSAIEAADIDVKPTDTEYVTEETTATVSTAGSDLNMRRGPDSNYSAVRMIPNGTKVEVYAYKGTWALVNYNGVYGWSSTSYLK